MKSSTTSHHFTIDVEEYFHPTALSAYYPMKGWGSLKRRSPEIMRRLVDLLAAFGVKATCFVVGWLAEREKATVRMISDAGHEIASHGWEHQLVSKLGPTAFRASVRRSKRTLEEISGRAVVGYRAPSFSIVPGLEWALDLLIEEGYLYDSSLFPVRQHPVYGYPSALPHPHRIERPSGSLIEVPPTTARVLGLTLPASGGAYFRVLPYRLVQTGLRQSARRGVPGTFYIHPWELDEWAPTTGAPRLQMWRTFAGRRRMWQRTRRLLGEFRFQPIIQTVAAMNGDATLSP